MSFDELLDRLLVARPNGSAELEQVAEFITARFQLHTRDVFLEPFVGTPHGFQLVWSVVLFLAVGYGCALLARRYGLALVLALLPSLLLLAEFEGMRSPISGWIAQTQHNVVADFPGRPEGPLLIFTAHYDTTTHIGDHFTWYGWSRPLGVASAIAPLVALLGLFRVRISRRWRGSVALLVPIPFAAMATFYVLGPIARTPSVGAIDNGGSVAVLLKLAERLQGRPPKANSSIRLVAFAGEEERALGSWHYARELAASGQRRVAVINLESLGNGRRVVYAEDDGWQFRRYPAGQELVGLLNRGAKDRGLPLIEAQQMPPGVLTDARSFMAVGIPAITLRGYTEAGFPRGLHSHRDSRDRLSIRALQDALKLLDGTIQMLDLDPSQIRAR